MSSRSTVGGNKLARGFGLIAAARRQANQTTAPNSVDVPAARAGLARLLAGFALPPSGSMIIPLDEISEYPITEVVPIVRSTRPPMIFIHGGGLIFHSVQTFLPLLDCFAAATGRRIFAIDYPKASEVSPRLLVEGLLRTLHATVLNLVEAGPVPTLVGDSVGGLVTLVCAHERLAEFRPGLILIQPLLDLDLLRGRPEATELDGGEFLDTAHLRWFVDLASQTTLGATAPCDFGYADFARLGPVKVVSPTCDILLASTQRFVMRAGQFGFKYHHVLLPGLPHDFALYAGRVAEAREGVHQLLDVLM